MWATLLRRTSFGRFARLICLILLASALVYAAVDQGGREPLGWDITLLLVGVGALFCLLVLSPDRSAPLERLIGWAILLPPAYVGLQLLPLPLSSLRILSPARAKLVESLAAITQAPKFAPLSIDPTATWVFLVRTLAYSLTALVIYRISAHWWRRQAWGPVFPLIGVAAFEACLGMIQFNDGADVAGTYRSKDHFAGALEMVLPLAVAYGISRLKGPDGERSLPLLNALKACLAFAAAATILVGLVYGQSKMGFVAGLAALFVMGAVALVSKIRGIRGWVSVAGLAVVVLLIFALLPTAQLANAYAEYFSHDPQSVEGRAPIWNDSRQLLRDYPMVGTGLGTYDTAFLKYQTANVDSDYTFAHNDYLQLASELGAVGFLIFGGVFAIALTKAVRAVGSEDWNTRLLGVGYVGALTAIGIHSLADFNLYVPANALLLSWIVGMAVSIPTPVRPLPAQKAASVRSPGWSARFFGPLSGLSQRAIPLIFCGLLVAYATEWLILQAKYKRVPEVATVLGQLGISLTGTVLAADGHTGTSADAPARNPLVRNVVSDPAAPDRWCDLGEAYLRGGRVQEARYCLSRALALGPEIPPILFRSAKFCYALHEDNLALKQGAHVLEISEVYRVPVLDWYSREKFNLTDVLSRGLPLSAHAAQFYLQYWIGLGDLASARVAWDWTLSHQFADLPTARQYIDFLFAHSKYQEAADDWARFLGPRRDGYRDTDWVFNGDFETEPSGVPFDWDIRSVPGQVETLPDSDVAYSGKHSLRIHFDGTENVNYAGTLENTSLPPGSYRFTAFIRTQDITTDKGLAFRIFDPENGSRLNISTDQFIGTHRWTKVEETFRLPAETKLVRIEVFRDATMKFDNKVSGTAWIDDVSLSRID